MLPAVGRGNLLEQRLIEMFLVFIYALDESVVFRMIYRQSDSVVDAGKDIHAL